MSRLATQSAPVANSSPSSGTVQAANRVEKGVGKSFVSLKQQRAAFIECFDKIEELWEDSTAGRTEARLSDTSYELGKAFLAAIPSFYVAPEVSLDVDGELVFDWYGNYGELVSVCAQSNGRLAYAARYSASRATHGHTVMDQTIPLEVIREIKAVAQ